MSSGASLYHMPTASILAAAAWVGKSKNLDPKHPVDIGVPGSAVDVADFADPAAQQQHQNQTG